MDPTLALGKAIKNKLQNLREEEPGLKDVAGYLEVSDYRLGRCSLLPKILKGLSSVNGHPVISNCGTMTEHICEFLDHQLNPLVSFTRSNNKDTNHFLARLTEIGSIPDEAFRCTVDVVGLYPSIPHSEGPSVIREALGRRLDPVVATDNLVGLASLVLNNNYFEFNNKIYRQNLGTAIGKKFAPAC